MSWSFGKNAYTNKTKKRRWGRVSAPILSVFSAVLAHRLEHCVDLATARHGRNHRGHHAVEQVDSELRIADSVSDLWVPVFLFCILVCSLLAHGEQKCMQKVAAVTRSDFHAICLGPEVPGQIIHGGEILIARCAAVVNRLFDSRNVVHICLRFWMRLLLIPTVILCLSSTHLVKHSRCRINKLYCIRLWF